MSTDLQYLALTDAMGYEPGPQEQSPVEFADALRKDAERYRWLRDCATVGTVHLQTPDGWAHYRSGADEVVDAAIAATPAVGAA